MTTAHIVASWGPRAESADSAAEKVRRLLAALAETDPLLTGWRDQAFSKKKALAASVVTASGDDLRTRLLAGRFTSDSIDDAIDNWGSSLSWWNANNEDAATAVLSIRVGIVSSKMWNSLKLQLPDSGKAQALYTPDTGRRLVSTIIEIFRPDRAVWLTRELEKLQKQPNKPLPDGSVEIVGIIGQPIGWATYLADTQSPTFDVAPLPKAATVEHVGGGTLVLLGSDPVNPPASDIFAVRAAMGYTVPPREAATPQAPAPEPAAPSAPSALTGEAQEAARPPAPKDSEATGEESARRFEE